MLAYKNETKSNVLVDEDIETLHLPVMKYKYFFSVGGINILVAFEHKFIYHTCNKAGHFVEVCKFNIAFDEQISIS